MNVICISGKPGSGSTTTAKRISEILNLDYFSPGRLFKDISTGKILESPYYKTFHDLCSKEGITIPSFHESNDSLALVSFWNSELGKSKEIHKIIDGLQKSLSLQGNAVFDGKLSIKMIDSDLKVWITASDRERAKRTAARDVLDLKEAEKIIIEREAKERKEWNSIYGFDYYEQEKLADLVIDSSDKTPEECADIILKSLAIKIHYKNWRGEESERDIIPLKVYFGSNEFHKERQWLLESYDLGKKAMRTFSLKDMKILSSPSI